ncbi:MAG: 4-(cytidine 5'-diphospho)-2-C-methyl-D-erythritol kinase [Actinobacteria bacterium]|nr:4-(cytidine 5'-diphospho)-2-C-methyl-D-erythritol kinase [Actinomycetota bacterium]
MTVIKKLTISSSGKINLYLNVSKTLRVDGYHEIKSIMQSISLADELDFEIYNNYGLSRYSSTNGNGNGNGNGISITCNNIDIPLNEKNLVHKAAQLMLKTFGLLKKYNVKININKSIPVSSGLAGGSSNAAATILAINKVFNLKLTADELVNLAGSVGSDVPFCLSGGTALVEGRGEKISELPDLPFYWVVVAVNGKKFSSGDVYDKFDLIGKEKKSIHQQLVDNINKKDYTKFFSGLDNDLERVVIVEDKMVEIIKKKAVELGAFASQMTGSGPAVFAFCPDLKTAKRVYSGLGEISNKVFLTCTTPGSQNIVN